MWQNKCDKIKRSVLCKNKGEGGLKMIHLDSYIKALKITWIRRLLNTEGTWQNTIFHSIDLKSLLHFGTEYLNKCINKTKNQFWKDVLQAWKALQFKQEQKDNYSSEQIQNNELWFNDKIKIGGKSIFYKKWYEKNIIYINDLLQDNGTFYKINEFKDKFNFEINFLEYNGIISVLRQLFRTNNQNELNKVQAPWIPPKIKYIIKSKKGSKDMYDILKMNNELPKAQKKWEDIFPNLDQDEWKIIYCRPFLITHDTKLHWFQYRINHMILTTNKFAFKIGICANSACTFCQAHEESIIHLLWECEHIQTLLDDIQSWLTPFSINLEINQQNFLLGTGKITKENLVMLLNIKYFIYVRKYRKEIPRIIALKITSNKFIQYTNV